MKSLPRRAIQWIVTSSNQDDRNYAKWFRTTVKVQRLYITAAYGEIIT